ncbi:MAG: radical SAM protein [Candidatus Zixiibacteriota bacterium]
MKIITQTGREELAIVYLAELESGDAIEFVESLQPPFAREKKWVLIVSTLIGCPANCPICDAGGFYKGRISKNDIFAQIDYLIDKRFPSRRVNVDKFKIQFARMGEPAFNPAVIDVLCELQSRYHAPGLMPCISTVAPVKTGAFFKRLMEVNHCIYRGRFQLQFSIHTTDDRLRDRFIPINKWDLKTIGQYGERFFVAGGRKIALNFALEKNAPVNADILREYFDPEIFLIKITPINPTYRAVENQMLSYVEPDRPERYRTLVDSLQRAGYEVILSIGELDENHIGSNCGQLVSNHMRQKQALAGAYSQAKT